MTDSIVCFGDSITFMAASRADRGYPSILDERLFSRGYCVGNNGVSGGGYSNAQSAYTGYYKNRGLWGACILVGVNDVAAGISAAVTFAGVNTLVQEMLADDLSVFLSTILPWKNGGGWTSAIQVATEAVNESILALEGTNGGLQIIDGYAAFGDPDDSELLARCYQEVTGDALHLGSYGAQVLAGLFYDSITASTLNAACDSLNTKINNMSDSRRFRHAFNSLATEARALVEVIRGDL